MATFLPTSLVGAIPTSATCYGYQFKFRRHCSSQDDTTTSSSSSSSSSSPACFLSLYVQQPSSPGAGQCERKEVDHTSLGTTHPTVNWLKGVLLPKLSKWTNESCKRRTENREQHSSTNKRSQVDMTRYSQLYRQLKLKYGPTLVKVS